MPNLQKIDVFWLKIGNQSSRIYDKSMLFWHSVHHISIDGFDFYTLGNLIVGEWEDNCNFS